MGLVDYYRLREKTSAPPAPADRRTLEAYDDPLFQTSFVRRREEGTLEAALLLDGVRCTACLWLIEESLKRLDGVCGVQVNYVTRRATLAWRETDTKLSHIVARLSVLGYGAHPYLPQQIDDARRSEKRRWLWRLFVAGFGMMQVMMYAVPAYIAQPGEFSTEYETLMRWASFVLTVPVIAYAAQPFFLGAYRGLRAGRAGMDLPVALGIATAFLASTWATFTHQGEVYFDSLTMFVFLLLLGRYLELRARESAGASLAHLARVTPSFAERLSAFPSSRLGERVLAAQLLPGDLLLVRPGEAIPADGVVLEGISTVDEALLTGESVPVQKIAGSAVVGGSQNVDSSLVVRVERVGQSGILASIARLVEQAAAQRPPLAEMADRYAQHFVWWVLIATSITTAVWAFIDPIRAPWIAVSLLVATCPCALSLATPVALTAATGRLARQSLIITKGHALETMAQATDYVFDKTGTLTEGKLSVVTEKVLGRHTREHCLAVIHTLENLSEHPIAKALCAHANASLRTPRRMMSLQTDSCRNIPGAGIQAIIDGCTYRVGTLAYCAEIARGPFGLAISTELSVSPYTRVWLATNDALLAFYDLSDCMKPDARALIGSLHAAGKNTHLLSGDGVGVVMEVARCLGMQNIRATATPEEKRLYVLALQRAGAKVVMVGDGVNDAPVLAQADVSIAMGSGATLAQTRADAVLLNGRLADLQSAISVSRSTRRIIHQNLFWSFGYNLAVIPLAAMGMLNPWIAGVGMSVSSLLVVLNALRLRA